MTFWRRQVPLILALSLGVIAGYGWHVRPAGNAGIPPEVFDRVVVPAPLQVAMATGDRFLAADLEAIRTLATPSDALEAEADNMSFAIRARNVVAQLNPCHEDNYYLANALLTWGGAVRQGNEVLRAAAKCRFWDEFPPFFYGFNLFYFQGDVPGATHALNQAADRSKENAPALRKLAIMITAGSLQDDAAALAYLENERKQAKDDKLRGMLDKRIARLQGLIVLRQAQAAYEQRFGKPLIDPQAIIETGLLQEFPADPLKIGYEFDEGRFRLREVRIAGLEPPITK
jgi:hypothetical protein